MSYKIKIGDPLLSFHINEVVNKDLHGKLYKLKINQKYEEDNFVIKRIK